MRSGTRWINLLIMPLICVALSLPSQAQEDDLNYSEMSLEDLLNVEVVSAGKTAQKVSEVPASVVVISRDEIERYGYTTLEDILVNVVGLYGIDQRENGGVYFGVRGFWTSTSNSIVFLVNGVRQERVSSDGGIFMLPRVNPESIDRIEVVRGPMSVLYGTSAFFGVINIVTNEASGDRGSQVAVSYGDYGTKRANARGAYEEGDLKVAFNFSHYKTEGLDEPYSRMTTHNLFEEFGVLRDTTKGRWSERRDFFNISIGLKDFYANAAYNYANRGADIFFPATEDGGISIGTYSSYSLGYNKEYSDKFTLDSKFTYHKGATKTKFDWFTPQDYPNQGGDQNYREDFEIDVTGFFHPNAKVDVTAGLYYKQIIEEQLYAHSPYIEYGYNITLQEPAEQQAVFVQADIRANDRLKFTLGVRADQAKAYDTYYLVFSSELPIWYGPYTEDDVEILPRFASIFKVSDSNLLKFFYGKAINHPSIYQTASQAPAGAPPTGPEFIETYELNNLLGFGKYSLNTSFFFNELDRLIIVDLIQIDNAIAVAATNSGVKQTKGAEVSFQGHPSESFGFELSASYQKTDDKSESFQGIDVAYSPKVLAYMKASYNFNKNNSLAILGRYVGEMETLYDITSESRIADATESYYVFDANLRLKNLKGSGYYLNFNVSNLLDEEYLHPSYTLSGTWADKGLVGTPRIIMVTAGKKF